MYKYKVDLLCVVPVSNFKHCNKDKASASGSSSTTNNTDGDKQEEKGEVAIPGVRFYSIPSEMKWDWAHCKKKDMKCDTYHLESFGLRERKILSSDVKIHHGMGEFLANQTTLRLPADAFGNIQASETLKGKKPLKNYFEGSNCPPPPEFLCNATCLKKLMVKAKNFTLVASRVYYDNGKYSIKLKAGKQYQNFEKSPKTVSIGHRVEDLLSSGVKDNKINQTTRLEAIYHAKLTGMDPLGNMRDIFIGFNAETDGVWKKNDDEFYGDIKKEDLVEVKCLTSNLFFDKLSPSGHKSNKSTNFFYEEQVIRENYSQCRLREIDKLLCGVVDTSDAKHKILKEIWLYEVNDIPRVINMEIPKTRKFRRCFPKIEFSKLHADEKYTTKQWNKWSEKSQFEALFDSLEIIRRSFLSLNGVLRKEKERHFAFRADSLTEITPEEYEQMARKALQVEVIVNENASELTFERIKQALYKVLKLSLEDFPSTVVNDSTTQKNGHKSSTFLLEFQKLDQRNAFFAEWENRPKSTKMPSKLSFFIKKAK